jgi:PAS domain-containing protein
MFTVVLIALTPAHAPATRMPLASPAGFAAVGLALFLLVLVAGLLILRELTDRECKTDQDLLGTFLEHIPDNVFFKDRNSRFLRINRAMANYIGLSDPAQALNKTDSDIFSSEHAGQAFEDEQRIIETGEAMPGMCR